MSEESQSDVTRRLILILILMAALPSVAGELSEMVSLTDSLNHFLTRHEILQITQTCAKVLQSINQSRDTSGLSTVLSLLQLAWTQWLELGEKLCSAVLTSIYNLVSLKDVTAVINPQLVGQVFRLLLVVSSHPQQIQSSSNSDLEQFPEWDLQPCRENPTYDGRGVIIAIFDSGIDPTAGGMHD